MIELPCPPFEGDDHVRLLACLCGWAALALLATASATPATARIRCDGPFMIMSQGPMATPYCEEQTIASPELRVEGDRRRDWE